MAKKRDRSRCELCGRAVLTVTMDNGKALDVDPQPDAEGSVCVQRNVTTGGLDAWYRRQDDGALTYRLHAATCPQAGLFPHA